MRRYWTIASLYQKFIVFTSSQVVVKFPDHVFIDFDQI